MPFSARGGFFAPTVAGAPPVEPPVEGDLWTPAVESTAIVWFDADDATTITVDGSNNVSQWDNKGSAAGSVSQATASKQPVYDPVNKFIAFDGADDVLTAASRFGITASPEWSAVSVVRYNTVQTGTVRYFQVGREQGSFGFSAGSDLVSMRYNNGKETYNAADTVQHLSSFNMITNNQYQNASYYEDGTEQSQSSIVGPTTTLNDTTALLNIGAGADPTVTEVQWADVEVSEIVYFEVQDDILRQRAEGYLAHKWGLEANLPVDHPYKSAPPVVVAAKATGGDIYIDGTDVYHIFTASDTFTPSESLDVTVLAVAGGGGGGWAGGGGAAGGGGGGEVVLDAPLSLTAIAHAITVGAGGAGRLSTGDTGSNGASSSVAALLTALGGGGGGSGGNQSVAAASGADGGSGGGSGRDAGNSTILPGGTSTAVAGVGFAGGGSRGDLGNPAGSGGGGGGGGASAVGVNAYDNAASDGGEGGEGLAVTGWSIYDDVYGSGAGGGTRGHPSDPGGVERYLGADGGTNAGRGGDSTYYAPQGTAIANSAGLANFGGGGGGAGFHATAELGTALDQVGANGGSGVVIIKYSGV